MSDSEIRDAERTYRASGAPQDGEAYVQAVLRTTGVNSTFLIARVIETQRALNALAGGWVMSGHNQEGMVQRALSMPVTPDDMVSFLRGGREWLTSPGFTRPTLLQDPDSLGYSAGAMARELPAIHPHQVGRNPTGAYDAVPTRGVLVGSAILCDNANENHGHCRCEPDCYCRQDGHTCSDGLARLICGCRWSRVKS